MKFCILISVLCLLTSVGLADDVGIDTIVRPSGTIDSGQAVVPMCAVHAYTSTGPVDVHFLIPEAGYHDSLALPPLPPGLVDSATFTPWLPNGRDSMTAVAWTVCAGDTNPENDTFRVRFLVEGTQLALELIVPQNGDTFDSGEVFNPQGRVWNLGNHSLNLDIQFICGDYHATRNINLIAGGATVVTAPTPYTAMPGEHLFILEAWARGRLYADSAWFYVRGTITTDVAALAVLSPPGVIDTTMPVTPEGRFGNLGTADASFEAFLCIRDPDGTEIYAESCQTILSPGDSTDIDYPSIKFSVLGTYTAICSTAMPGDQNSTNDVVRKHFRVAERRGGDIGVVEIFPPLPPDFIPGAVIRNYGVEEAAYSAYFFIHNKYGVRMYSDSQLDLLIWGGDTDTLYFIGFNVGNDTGRWRCRCSLATGDTNFLNDTLSWWWFPGVEESQLLTAYSSQPAATVIRGVLRLPFSPFTIHYSLFTPDGRRALALKPGASDVSGLSPGVYFVVSEPSAASRQQSAVNVRKVVIQR